MAGKPVGNHDSPATFYQNLVGVLAPPLPPVASITTGSSSSTAPQPTIRTFRKGGVITSLDEYTAVPSCTAAGPGPATVPPSGAPARLGPQIQTSNVGYQLLKKAGWQEGQGLGSSQQGRSTPLAAFHQQARQGIGVHGQRPGSADQAQAAQANSTGRGRSKAAAAQQAGAVNANLNPKDKRLLPVPDVPEAVEVKRKRHQQMIQAEADEEDRRAIQRHMYRAFNDLGGEATSDSNPLARPNKLTRTNPLLGKLSDALQDSRSSNKACL